MVELSDEVQGQRSSTFDWLSIGELCRQLVQASSTSGTPAKVVLADEPPSTSSPSIPDDPSISNLPPSSSSTVLSAPTPNNQTLQEGIPSGTYRNSEAGLQQHTQGTLQAASSQVLGRRRRDPSEDLEGQDQVPESLEDSANTQVAANDHRAKRRRQGSRMRLEGEGSNSNGTSRPFSNGSGASSLHKAAISNSANGTRRSSVAMNGSTGSNGHSISSAKQRQSYFGHDREEVTRILIQALTDLGYNNAASNLSQESGYELESPTVAEFRNAVLHGEWSLAEDLLFGGTAGRGSGSNSNGLVLQDGVDRNVMRFWLRQQKYLELLERRDTGGALMVLRLELTPLYQDTSKLHFLSSLLMCQSTDDLKGKAEWDGAEGNSRHDLLSELSKCISPSVMLPEHRLAVLLHQVKRNQISTCLYHHTASSPSLYQDHTCDKNLFPTQIVMELDKHSGEVWQLKFSNDGTRLATCGEDGTCVIYDVGSFDVLQSLSVPDSGICSFAWSPDDSMIVTCSRDKYATLWNSITGIPKRKLTRFGEPVSSCVWAPDGQTFVTGCLDKERNLCQWNLNGELVYDWGRSHRIQDLAVSPNGHYLVAMENDTRVFVYNFVTRELEYELNMEVKMGSVSISQNSRYLLVNKLDGEAKMLDLDTRETVRDFRSPDKGGHWIIRAAYGGANESFVVIGSEDGFVYIWHKETGQLIEKLEGHKKGCNSVAWSPTNPSMFASAGDDNKVLIWANMETLPKRTSQHSNGSQRQSTNGR